MGKSPQNHPNWHVNILESPPKKWVSHFNEGNQPRAVDDSWHLGTFSEASVPGSIGFPILVYLEPFDDLYLLKGPKPP